MLCSVISVEVLRGARNQEEYAALAEALGSLPQITMDEAVFERAALWGFLLDRKGRIVSTTDLLIAAAGYQKATLLHNDGDYELISDEVPLVHERLRP